jgi:hypothetical protein
MVKKPIVSDTATAVAWHLHQHSGRFFNKHCTPKHAQQWMVHAVHMAASCAVQALQR